MHIDIAANLTDDMFNGVYHDKKRHEGDIGAVIDRSKAAGCEQMIVLAGTLSDAKKCLSICEQFDPEMQSLFTTVGFHPTRCDEILPLLTNPDLSDDAAVDEMHAIFTDFIAKAGEGRVVAIGEFGLDYDRLQFCTKEVQRRFFEIQLRVASRFELPLLLHLRNAFDDFEAIYERFRTPGSRGVVHSFTGTRQEMERLVDMGLYIGINGCSLREAMDVVPHIPDDRIMYETDAPYCDIRPTHPGFGYLANMNLPKTVKPEKFVLGSLVKGRNEPCCIDQVAVTVAGIRGADAATLSAVVRRNTLQLFKKLVRYPEFYPVVDSTHTQKIFSLIPYRMHFS